MSVLPDGDKALGVVLFDEVQSDSLDNELAFVYGKWSVINSRSSGI